MEFKETVDAIEAEKASVQSLFGGDGTRVRGDRRRKNPKYMESLAEAANFIADIESGAQPFHMLREAMTTSDFPALFADVLDRQMLGFYRETEPIWQNFCRQSIVPDFRNVKRFAVDGAEGVLDPVEERTEYPEAALQENVDTYAVRKYGRRLDLSWEAMVNDDLDAFRRNPERLARAARRSEDKFATQLYVGANGPHASLYQAGFNNIVTGNPPLSTAALQIAMQVLAAQVDADGEPIQIDAIELVVPPALEVVANNILHAMVIDVREGPGADYGHSRLQAQNWMSGRVRLSVSPYIPIVATANGTTSWFLFASPSSGRPALEFGKLRGYEDPALYERMPDARLVGGGGEALESFDDDSVAWRIRHVFGGTRLTQTGGAKATVASDGTGVGS